METNPQNYRNLLSIRTGHLLELSDSKTADETSGPRESHLFKELNSANEMVAYYRVWEAVSSKAPFRKQRGWEKYSPDGELLIREVKFSQLQDEVSPTLH